MAFDILDLDLSSFNQLFLIGPVHTATGVQHRVTQVQLATGTAIATPDTPPPDTTTTEKPSLTNITDNLPSQHDGEENKHDEEKDNLPSPHVNNSCTVSVVVTPEKPADNIPSPHAGEVHVLKMIVEDVDLDVHVKKEPEEKKVDEDQVATPDTPPPPDTATTDKPSMTNIMDNLPSQHEDQVIGHDEEENNCDEEKEKEDSVVHVVHDGQKPQEDEMIENEDNKHDDKKDKDASIVSDVQKPQVIEKEKNKPDDEKDKEDSALKDQVIDQRARQDEWEEKEEKKHEVMEKMTLF